VGRPTAVDIDLAGKRIARGMKLWPIGTSLLKSELYGWLRMARPTDEARTRGETDPPGYCHFPQYGEEHFRQLCAEELQRKETRKGYTVFEWVKTRERNEALDTRVYARAAAIQAGVLRTSKAAWSQLEGQFREAEVEREAQPPVGPANASTDAPSPESPEGPRQVFPGIRRSRRQRRVYHSSYMGR
jgi:phage terminase large subunit GpA-like protein